jgi:hypothetical protein
VQKRVDIAITKNKKIKGVIVLNEKGKVVYQKMPE